MFVDAVHGQTKINHKSIYLCLQIGWGYVHPLTPSTSGTGVIDLFPYVHNSGCNNIVSNSIFHNEYSQGDPGSATVLDEVSKIVSSSTYFKQVGRCRNNQFMAKWAFEVTWIEVVDQNDDCNTVSCRYETWLITLIHIINSELPKILHVTFLVAQHLPASTDHRWGTNICCDELCTH